MKNTIDNYEFLKLQIKVLLDIQKSMAQKFSDKNRKFTLDGRLVGDLGEIIVDMHYDITLHNVSKPKFDAEDSKGRNIQIKATFQDALTFNTKEGYYIGIKIYEDGSFKEIYNGPAKNIYKHFESRKGIGETLLRFANAKLNELSKEVRKEDRISLRK